MYIIFDYPRQSEQGQTDPRSATTDKKGHRHIEKKKQANR